MFEFEINKRGFETVLKILKDGKVTETRAYLKNDKIEFYELFGDKTAFLWAEIPIKSKGEKEEPYLDLWITPTYDVIRKIKGINALTIQTDFRSLIFENGYEVSLIDLEPLSIDTINDIKSTWEAKKDTIMKIEIQDSKLLKKALKTALNESKHDVAVYFEINGNNLRIVGDEENGEEPIIPIKETIREPITLTILKDVAKAFYTSITPKDTVTIEILSSTDTKLVRFTIEGKKGTIRIVTFNFDGW